MRRILLSLISFIICPFILDSCEKEFELVVDIRIERIDDKEDEEEQAEAAHLDFEEIMALDDTRYSQGGDCWGDYFFQFVKNNFSVRIYDLFSKKLVQTVSIPPSERGFVTSCHCNTVCFGSEYYEENDLFPLIYVSTGYASDGYTGALVYRITKQNNSFVIKLVQTIKFPVDKSSWTEFVPGGEFAYLCYTSERVIFKFKMPQLKEGDLVLARNSALESFQFTTQPKWLFNSRGQDRLYLDGRVLYITGVPQCGEESALVILNLETLEREKIYDLKKNGLTTEPESIFIWKNDLCVAFIDRIVKVIL